MQPVSTCVRTYCTSTTNMTHNEIINNETYHIRKLKNVSRVRLLKYCASVWKTAFENICNRRMTLKVTQSSEIALFNTIYHFLLVNKVKFSHTRYRALGPELIPVYRQSAHRWLEAIHPPIGRYQIILLGDRGTCVWAACPRLLPGSGPAEIRTCDLLDRKQMLYR